MCQKLPLINYLEGGSCVVMRTFHILFHENAEYGFSEETSVTIKSQ